MAFRRLQHHLPKYQIHAKLLPVGLMVFFFVLFDGILMYFAPIVITNAGISESLMGLIIGSSSIAGLIFDFILTRAIKVTHYRRMFLMMFILAALFPLFLFGGTSLTFYLMAMAVWGFYYDFYNIGTLDFVERTADTQFHVSHFGMLRSFEGTGYFLAPFIASLLLLFLHPDFNMFLALLVPLGIAFIFYLMVVLKPIKERQQYLGVKRKSVLSFFSEMELWKKIGGALLPILLLTLVINLVDAAIWTFGPIFSQAIGTTNDISGGIFMTVYALPPLLVGWVVGLIARKFGNTQTGQGAIALGSLALIPVGLVSSPLFLAILIFIASFFICIGWPSINAIYTEHIAKLPVRRKEIETLQDFFTNCGDTFGPIVGGYLAQYLGFAHSFIALGVGGAAAAIILFLITPRTINIKV